MQSEFPTNALFESQTICQYISYGCLISSIPLTLFKLEIRKLPTEESFRRYVCETFDVAADSWARWVTQYTRFVQHYHLLNTQLPFAALRHTAELVGHTQAEFSSALYSLISVSIESISQDYDLIIFLRQVLTIYERDSRLIASNYLEPFLDCLNSATEPLGNQLLEEQRQKQQALENSLHALTLFHQILYDQSVLANYYSREGRRV